MSSSQCSRTYSTPLILFMKAIKAILFKVTKLHWEPIFIWHKIVPEIEHKTNLFLPYEKWEFRYAAYQCIRKAMPTIQRIKCNEYKDGVFTEASQSMNTRFSETFKRTCWIFNFHNLYFTAVKETRRMLLGLQGFRYSLLTIAVGELCKMRNFSEQNELVLFGRLCL